MKNKIYFLESLRGLAAIYVVIHHGRWLLTESYSHRHFTNIDVNYVVTKTLSLFRFGHEAVIFFFILSGFVIHYANENKTQRTTVSYIDYLKKRINRIIPPLIFALIITFSLDYLGKHLFELPIYFNGSKYYGLVVDNLNWKTFFGNVFSLQELNFGIKHFGSNVALWSLSYEWWFYLLYPIFYKLNLKNKYFAFLSQIVLFVLFSVVINKTYPIASSIFSKMIIWWFGVILADFFLKNKKLLPYFSILILGIPLAILFFYNDRLFGDIFWGIGFFGLLSFLLSIRSNTIIMRLLNKFKNTGSFSYTLYLTHVPIIFLAHAFLINFYKGVLPLSHTYLFLISFLCIVFAKFSSPYIERFKIFRLQKN